ncbi:hypothetical protein B9G53_06525 [Pseudanabaena sp. SR411]|uniref:GUN4 domain-containing protein n=1 Tax=Pseudanabaena sp. SR411 TaxID=1980935 RepID=UPI000B99BA5F|nr:GUN4 domain-containing protein [Pseudanabaena sp. SR411]OYQ65707.1 hypothetical protein B9G53_06525 [Pseudanabaena sp. SR411]
MVNWHKVKEKVWEFGGKVLGGVAESLGLSFGKKVFGIAPHSGGSNHDSAIATALSSNSIAMKAFADAQNSLVAVQAEQNKLQKAGLVLNAIALAQKAQLAQKERELKEKLCEITCNLQRELQKNEFQNRGELQAVQIQAKWDEKELPTIFSRRELTDIFAQKSDFPLFICSKIQITEGSPKYFQTELAAEVESKMLTFANSTFRRDVRFYSRFFKDRDVFDVNAEQLKTILPDTPCVMSFSKLTRSNVHFHYKLWGSQIAEIFHGHFDLEFSWREEFLQPLLDSVGEVSDHDLDNIYEMIGDWLTALQKLIATFLMDLYAIVDGDNPFYIPKLDRVNVGLPEAVREKYIQPYFEILEKIQKERIDAFNEALRWQQEEVERQRQEELRRSRKEKVRIELERQRLVGFQSQRGMEAAYRKLDILLTEQKWRKADELTREIILKLANCNSRGYLNCWDIDHNDFPRQDLRTIDLLWVNHSNGKFGFSVQRELYLDCCQGKIDHYGYETWKQFARKTGWHNPDTNYWAMYDSTIKDNRTFPHASLPAVWECVEAGLSCSSKMSLGGRLSVEFFFLI